MDSFPIGFYSIVTHQYLGSATNLQDALALFEADHHINNPGYDWESAKEGIEYRLRNMLGFEIIE